MAMQIKMIFVRTFQLPSSRTRDVRSTSLVRSLRGKQLSEALSTFQRFTASGGRVTRHIFSTLLKLGRHRFSLVRVVLFLHFGVPSGELT